jgi:hypothetical protein
MKKTIIGVYKRNKNIIMVAQQLIEVMNMIRVLTVLSVVTVGLLVYLVLVLRKQPRTEVILAPMGIDFEDGTGIEIEPVDERESYHFKNNPFFDPNRPN